MYEWFLSYLLMLLSFMFAYLLNKFPTRRRGKKTVANIIFYVVLFMAFRLIGTISRELELQLNVNYYFVAFPVVIIFIVGIILSRFLLTKYLVVIDDEKEDFAKRHM